MANRQINIENLTMNEVLKSMHRLGGQVSRKEIRQDIHDNSDMISEDEVDRIRVSRWAFAAIIRKGTECKSVNF